MAAATLVVVLSRAGSARSVTGLAGLAGFTRLRANPEILYRRRALNIMTSRMLPEDFGGLQPSAPPAVKSFVPFGRAYKGTVRSFRPQRGR